MLASATQQSLASLAGTLPRPSLEASLARLCWKLPNSVLTPLFCRAVKCILRWAAHRDTPTCPQCKAPFDSLLTYYRLDGTLNDFPCEESVCLLKRARFFTDHMQVCC